MLTRKQEKSGQVSLYIGLGFASFAVLAGLVMLCVFLLYRILGSDIATGILVALGVAIVVWAGLGDEIKSWLHRRRRKSSHETRTGEHEITSEMIERLLSRKHVRRKAKKERSFSGIRLDDPADQSSIASPGDDLLQNTS